MKKLWHLIGIVSYYVLLPALYIYLRFSKRTRVAVTNKDQLLVVKPWLGNGKWTLPGGGVHKGEAAENAVIRETKEETGIELEQVNFVDQLVYSSSGLRFGYDFFYATVSIVLTIKMQQLEVVAAKWVSLKKLNKSNSNHDVLMAVQWLQQR